MLCLDDSFIISRENAALSAPDIKKHGPVLPDVTYGGDKWRNCVFCSPVIKMPDGTLRMYSSCSAKGKMYIGAQESEDGLNWGRIHTGGITYAGEKTHFLKITGADTENGHTQPSVVLLPDGTWRMFCWMHGARIRYICCESRDGLSWRAMNTETPCLYHPNDSAVDFAALPGLTPHSAGKNSQNRPLSASERGNIKRLISNDSTFTYFDPERALFEMYSVWLLPNDPSTGRYVEYDNAPMALRTIHRRTSKNGLDWSDPELIITPGEKDPASMQFYYLASNKRAGWRIGFLGRYICADQTMDIELAWSRDGVRWERGLRGPWLKRGAPGEADCCMTHASHSLLDTGESHYLYYSGDDGLHNAVILNKPINTKVMLAEFGRNRFAGLRNHPGKTALAETSPFILCADSIRVNGNIAGGLKAELRDAHGRTLAGHSFEDSDLLKGDSVSGVLSWRGDGVLSSRKHEALSLSVKWNDGIIYEIDFK